MTREVIGSPWRSRSLSVTRRRRRWSGRGLSASRTFRVRSVRAACPTGGVGRRRRQYRMASRVRPSGAGPLFPRLPLRFSPSHPSGAVPPGTAAAVAAHGSMMRAAPRTDTLTHARCCPPTRAKLARTVSMTTRTIGRQAGGPQRGGQRHERHRHLPHPSEGRSPSRSRRGESGACGRTTYTCAREGRRRRARLGAGARAHRLQRAYTRHFPRAPRGRASGHRC